MSRGHAGIDGWMGELRCAQILFQAKGSNVNLSQNPCFRDVFKYMSRITPDEPSVAQSKDEPAEWVAALVGVVMGSTTAI